MYPPQGLCTCCSIYLNTLSSVLRWPGPSYPFSSNLSTPEKPSLRLFTSSYPVTVHHDNLWFLFVWFLFCTHPYLCVYSLLNSPENLSPMKTYERLASLIHHFALLWYNSCTIVITLVHDRHSNICWVNLWINEWMLNSMHTVDI